MLSESDRSFNGTIVYQTCPSRNVKSLEIASTVLSSINSTNKTYTAQRRKPNKGEVNFQLFKKVIVHKKTQAFLIYQNIISKQKI